ncbi:hypothetical protein BLNAU_19108 [Blattamonas nauphoetae]|uniref:Uncharacterized protein n=1 Tax=Blattamonas nauphoetae TaxID=2049346 RepID=A0ABQ9X2H5_9EUKA|nr:hypothetical protein BLNAU_19108 [Blattamonas nauphoetae]
MGKIVQLVGRGESDGCNFTLNQTKSLLPFLQGREVFVGEDGDEDNDGMNDSPLRTLFAAFTKMKEKKFDGLDVRQVRFGGKGSVFAVGSKGRVEMDGREVSSTSLEGGTATLARSAEMEIRIRADTFVEKTQITLQLDQSLSITANREHYHNIMHASDSRYTRQQKSFEVIVREKDHSLSVHAALLRFQLTLVVSQMGVRIASFLENCDPFLNWTYNRNESVHEKAVVFRSLVATVTSKPALDDSLEARAVKLLESVDPSTQESADDFLISIASSSDEYLNNFIQSIVVLLSIPNLSITTATMKMLRNMNRR